MRGSFSDFGGLGMMAVPRWAFMPRLMGPDSAEYTEGQQGSALTFLFTQSAVLCVHTALDWRPTPALRKTQKCRDE